VRQLGADEVIGYTTSRFEDHVENVEMVFDAVGGDTLDQSWAVLRLASFSRWTSSDWAAGSSRPRLA